MNKKIWLAFVILVVLAGGSLSGCGSTTQKTAPANMQNVVANGNENQNETKPEPQKELREAILKVEKGEVDLRRGSDSQTINTSAVLKEGDMITTGSKSEAMIVFADDSVVRLNENTQIFLSTIDLSEKEKQIDMLQSFGETWHKVSTLLGNDRYSVRHGDTIVGVRGTVFDLRIPAKKKIQLSVISSQVEVINARTKKSQLVKERNALLYDEEKPEFNLSSKLYEDLSSSPWFENNNKADEVLDELKKTEPDLFEYYREAENLNLFPDTLPVLDSEGNTNSVSENWWEAPELYKQLPAEYMKEYEAGWREYEKFLQEMKTMNLDIDWAEYDAAMESLKNLNMNFDIPDEVYDSMEQLKNMNFSLPPDMPKIPSYQIPAYEIPSY